MMAGYEYELRYNIIEIVLALPRLRIASQFSLCI